MPPSIRVLIVDDHPMVREGLHFFLSEDPSEIDVVGQAADGLEAIEKAKALHPDVVLLDIEMPQMGGIETLRRLRADGVACPVLILTTFADEAHVREALEAGARGYLLKDVDRSALVAAIRSAAQGRSTLHPVAQEHLIRRVTSPPRTSPIDGLTEREREVLALVAQGQSNKAIARALSLTVGTVKGHVSAVLEKLGVSSRTQAALLAVEHGLTDAAEAPDP